MTNDTGECFSETELKYGPVLIKEKNKVLIDYLNYKKEKFDDIYHKISLKNETDNSERLKEVEHEIDIINQCLKIIEL